MVWRARFFHADCPVLQTFGNLVPAGLYLGSPAFFGALETGGRADMILEVIPNLLASGGRVAVYNTPEYLRDVGTVARHARAQRYR